MSELTPYPREAAEREEAESPPGHEADVVLSGWWRRAGALLLDGLVVTVIVTVALGVGALVTLINEDLGAILLIVGLLFAFAGPIFYWIYLTGKAPGQTVGKKALGIRVRHAEQDRAIGYGPSAGRYLITVVFGIFYVPLLFDYLWPLWDKRNQSLHDKVANSIVVRVRP